MPLSRSNHSLTSMRGAIIAFVIYLVAIVLSLCLMPGAPPVSTAVTMIVLSMAGVMGLHRAHVATSASCTMLIIASTVLAVGVIANVWYFTTLSGGTDNMPVLHNIDARRTWGDAMYYLGQSTTRSYPSHGLTGMIYAGIFAFTGPSITAGLLASMAMTLITLVCAAILGVRLSGDRTMAWKTMMATAAICYLMASGMILIKDAWVIAAIALSSVALTDMNSYKSLAPLTISMAILMFMRPNMILAVLVGVTVFTITSRQQLSRRMLTIAGVMLIIGIIFWIIPTRLHFTAPAIDVMTESLAGRDDVVDTTGWHKPYYDIVGNNSSIGHRLLMLPLSIAVQFFIPFPWNFMRDVPFGLSQIYAHVAYPWYIFGAIFIYYLLIGRRHIDRRYMALSIWATIIWLAPCWTIGGTASRYALPAVALLAPAVVQTWNICHNKRSFKIFMTIFAVLAVITLLICHHVQSQVPQ